MKYYLYTLLEIWNEKKTRKGWEQPSNLCLSWRIWYVERHPMYVEFAPTVFTVQRKTKLRQNKHITCFHKLKELHTTIYWWFYHICKVTKGLKFLSFNRELFQLQRIILWWTVRNSLVPHLIYLFMWGFL